MTKDAPLLNLKSSYESLIYKFISSKNKSTTLRALKAWEPENSTKTLKPGFSKYDVDINLFRLGSTNPKKKFPAPGCFFFYSNCFSRIDLDPKSLVSNTNIFEHSNGREFRFKAENVFSKYRRILCKKYIGY